MWKSTLCNIFKRKSDFFSQHSHLCVSADDALTFSSQAILVVANTAKSKVKESDLVASLGDAITDEDDDDMQMASGLSIGRQAKQVSIITTSTMLVKLCIGYCVLIGYYLFYTLPIGYYVLFPSYWLGVIYTMLVADWVLSVPPSLLIGFYWLFQGPRRHLWWRLGSWEVPARPTGSLEERRAERSLVGTWRSMIYASITYSFLTLTVSPLVIWIIAGLETGTDGV